MMKFIILALLSFSIATVSGQTVSRTNVNPSVTVGWNPSPSPGIATYSVYQGVTPAIYTNVFTAGTNLTFTINTNLVRGVTYYYVATAKDTNGLESLYSNQATNTVNSLPAAPTSLTVTGN